MYQITCISNDNYVPIQAKEEYDLASFVFVLVHTFIYILIYYFFSLFLHSSNDNNFLADGA